MFNMKSIQILNILFIKQDSFGKLYLLRLRLFFKLFLLILDIYFIYQFPSKEKKKDGIEICTFDDISASLQQREKLSDRPVSMIKSKRS